MIKYQNCHVYPSEIEDVALCHPDIIDIGVYGQPDPKFQELVSCVIVKRCHSNLSEKDVIAFINNHEKISDHQRIRGGVGFVKSISRNPQGKIIRSKLQSNAKFNT